MAGFSISDLLSGVNANNPSLNASNPTFGQSGSGLYTPSGQSALDDILARIASPVGGGGGGAMDIALARAGGLAGPLSAGVPRAVGGSLMPYSAEAAAAASNPLVAAMRQAGIGSLPFNLGGGNGPIAMGRGGAAPTLENLINPAMRSAAPAGAESAFLNPAMLEEQASALGGAASGAGAIAEGAGAGAPLWRTLLAGSLPKLGTGAGGRSLLSTFLRGAPAVGEEGAVAGALNPYTLLGLAGPMAVNAVVPSSKGRQVAADALAGLGAGAGIGAGIGAVGGPIGSGFGALVGALGGATYGFLHNKPKPPSLQQGEDKITKLMDTAQLDDQARNDILGNVHLAWTMAEGDHAKEKTVIDNAMQLIPGQRESMVDRLTQQMAMAQYLPQIREFMAPTISHMTQQAQNNYDLIAARSKAIPGERGEFLRSSALQQLADVQNQAHSQETAMAFYPIMQQLAAQSKMQTSVDNAAARKQLASGGTGTASSGGSTDYAAALAQALQGNK